MQPKLTISQCTREIDPHAWIVRWCWVQRCHPTQTFSIGFQDEEENRREEGRVQEKDHVGEIQRGYGHNPVKQDKFIGFPSQLEDANEMWVNMAKTIRTVAKEILGCRQVNQKCSKSRGGGTMRWKRR